MPAGCTAATRPDRRPPTAMSTSPLLQDPLPEGRFEGRQAFAERVRLALARAAQAGWSRLVLSDPDFADWPLGERAVIESLNAWAGQGRQLRLLAQDFAPLRLQHPRFVQWRTTWSHIVEARAWSTAPTGDLPSAFWTPSWHLERLDLLRSTGVCGEDPARRTVLQERIENAWGRGQSSFPASVLGL